MIDIIDKCLRCGKKHVNLQLYKFNETVFIKSQYYVKCPETNKFVYILYT